MHYLPGKFNSDESLAGYRRLIAAWAAGVTEDVPTKEQSETTVAVVLEAYRLYAAKYYGEHRGSRYKLLLPTIKIVRELFADLPADEFTPKKLKLVRQAFVDRGYTRGHTNDCTERVVGVFRWAVSEELVHGSLVHALEAVQPLRYGHTTAPEGSEVESVEQAVVDATLPHLVPVLQDMIRLQLTIGCRPGELCRMTPGEIDRSGDIWFYRPAQYKNRHRRHKRIFAIGPKAQPILRPYLLRPADSPCFSPKEALAQFYDQQHERQETPMNQGNKSVPAKRQRAIARVHDSYDVASYRRAIYRACDRGFPAPKKLTAQERRQWQTEHHWFPYQLRHTCGEVVREQMDLDSSQAILGGTVKGPVVLSRL